MKIYRVIFTSNNIDEGENIIKIKTFLNEETALKYYKNCLKDLKKEQEELDMDDYQIDEDATSYERYLDERAVEDSVSLWLEPDDTYDEIVLEKEQKTKNKKEKDYEM